MPKDLLVRVTVVLPSLQGRVSGGFRSCRKGEGSGGVRKHVF